MRSSRLKKSYALVGVSLAVLAVALPQPGLAAPRAPQSRTPAAPPAIAHPLLGRALQTVASFGMVTSINRTAEHNRRVGGVPNSYHLVGQAIDVRRNPGVTHQAIDAALRRAGYQLIESLDEVDHSHFAFLSRPASTNVGARPVTNVPAKEETSPSLWLADDHGVLAVDQHVLRIETADARKPATSGRSPQTNLSR